MIYSQYVLFLLLSFSTIDRQRKFSVRVRSTCKYIGIDLIIDTLHFYFYPLQERCVVLFMMIFYYITLIEILIPLLVFQGNIFIICMMAHYDETYLLFW